MRLNLFSLCLLFGALLLCLSRSSTLVLADPEIEIEVASDDGVEGPPKGLSEEELAAVKDAGETHEFQAEVHRLMDIIINSLYSSREIFLRELISNSADALDKVRFQSLTDGNVLGGDGVEDLDIRISVDPIGKTLTITDKGIGMRKEDLIKNLGVVAKSGTADFIESVTNAASENSALSLIGQFGVGFYSVYLVADEVTVVSKHNDDPKQWIWHSDADKVFRVSEDPRGNTLGRGTSVILHLKEDSEEFLDQDNLQRLVQRYSSFINFPIRLLTVETVTREEPIEDDEEEDILADDDDATADADDDDDDDLEVSEDDEVDEDVDPKPKTRTVTEEVREWKVLNDAKAIWTRSSDEIEDEEYAEFYKSISKDPDNPLTHTHFTAEGEISFRSLLYVPKRAPPGLYDRLYEKSNSLRLFVRRVLIADEFDDFLPRYLSFIKGVVDSEDLPLNVNRESLAQNRILKVMSKKLTRKALEMLRKLAEKDHQDEEDQEDFSDGEDGEEQIPKVEKDENELTDYEQFWKEFGKSIKLGVLDDRSNKNKLSQLLRFQTSKSGDRVRSLEQYVEDMPEDQKYIYYITGESLDAVKRSPFLEAVNRKGYEVLYLVDPLDEYLTQALTEFDGVNLMSVQKEGFKTGEEDEAFEKKLKEKYEPLTKWLSKLYGNKVAKVVVSNRIEKSPCVLVTSQYGWSANMERIMKAQTLGDARNQQFMFSRRTMEINPRHPLIRALYDKVVEEGLEEDVEAAAGVKDLAELMYDAALVNSGFSIGEDAKDFASRIHRVVGSGLGVDPEADLLPQDEFEEEEEEEEEDGDVDEVDLDMDDDDDDDGHDDDDEDGEEEDEKDEAVERDEL